MTREEFELMLSGYRSPSRGVHLRTSEMTLQFIPAGINRSYIDYYNESEIIINRQSLYINLSRKKYSEFEIKLKSDEGSSLLHIVLNQNSLEPFLYNGMEFKEYILGYIPRHCENVIKHTFSTNKIFLGSGKIVDIYEYRGNHKKWKRPLWRMKIDIPYGTNLASPAIDLFS